MIGFVHICALECSAVMLLAQAQFSISHIFRLKHLGAVPAVEDPHPWDVLSYSIPRLNPFIWLLYVLIWFLFFHSYFKQMDAFCPLTYI